MKSDLINYIICPVCCQSLELNKKTQKGAEIIDGILKCKRKHKFLIKNGIPRMIVDKDLKFLKTRKAFSTKWEKFYRDYQSKKWYDFTEKWFLDRFGWKNKKEFKSFLLSKKFVLDAGTGVGNSANMLSANPNCKIFAIDASKSIDFAYKKYGNKQNIYFIQADILQLPFKKRFFDYILSDQVLHHTKNTKLAFRKLASLLNKKGIISIYVYNKKAPIREFSDNFIREKTTKMNERDCLNFSKQITLLGKSLSKIKEKIIIKESIPLLGIKTGTYDVQRFFYWNVLKCFWANDGNFERSLGVNFDWYYPKFAWRHTVEEVKKWNKELGLKVIILNEIESGINATSKKL